MNLIFVMHHLRAVLVLMVSWYQSTMVSVGKSQLSAQFGSHCHAYAIFVQYFLVDLNPVTGVVKNDQVLLYCDAG
jgi:hypothetical protein